MNTAALESRSSHARNRMSTYECVFHGDRIDGTGISSMPGYVYIGTQSHATTPCGVLMLPSCVLFLFPRSRDEIREIVIVDHRGENWSREWFLRGRDLRNPASRMLTFHPRERQTMLFFELGSARLCPNTSIFRVAYNIARALLYRGLLSRDLDEENTTDYC